MQPYFSLTNYDCSGLKFSNKEMLTKGFLFIFFKYYIEIFFY
jgi:hypothetical protein